jgi:hypothetical protein
MKKSVAFRYPVLVLATMLVACGGGNESPVEENAAPEPQALGAGPLLKFDTTEHEFGTIDDVSTQHCSYSFVNAGSETLTIREVKPTCACLKYVLNQRTFEPGQGGTIEVDYDPVGDGKQRRMLQVLSNSVEEPLIELWVDAMIESVVQFEPYELSFPDAVQGRSSTGIFRLSSRDPDMIIESAKITNKAFEASVIPDPLPNPQPGSTHPRRVVEVRVRPDAAWGISHGMVDVVVRGKLVSDNRSFLHKVRGMVHANVFRTIEPSSNWLSVGIVPAGQTFEGSVQLHHRGGEPFEINSARILQPTAANMETRVEPVEGSDGSAYDLFVTGAATLLQGRSDGRIRGTIVIQTDVPGDENLTIQIAGKIE